MKLEKPSFAAGFGTLPSDEWYARFYYSRPYERSRRAVLGNCAHRNRTGYRLWVGAHQ